MAMASEAIAKVKDAMHDNAARCDAGTVAVILARTFEEIQKGSQEGRKQWGQLLRSFSKQISRAHGDLFGIVSWFCIRFGYQNVEDAI